MDNRAGATSPTPNTPDHKGNPDAWTEWLATPPGRYLLQWEGRQLACAVGNVFGYYAVQLGMPALDALADNRMPHRIRVPRVNGSPTCGWRTTASCPLPASRWIWW